MTESRSGRTACWDRKAFEPSEASQKAYCSRRERFLPVVPTEGCELRVTSYEFLAKLIINLI